MKKTLIASAVAAAALSSNAIAMDNATDLAERLDSMPTFYGNIQLVNNTIDTDNGVTDDSASSFDDNGSTLGIKHEHMISDDVTAFMKAEWEFNADDKDNASDGIDDLDEAYIGFKGGFGSIQFGSDDSVYEWVDHVDIEEAIGVNSDVAGVAEGDNLQYVSPKIAESLEIGITLPLDPKGTTEHNFAVAANYEMDALAVTLAYAGGRDRTDTEDTIGLAGTFTVNDDLALTAQFETQDDAADLYALMANYSMGANNFNFTYSATDFDGAEEQTDIFLQALHNLSDNSYVYVEYVMSTDVGGVEDVDVDALSVGAAYSF